MDFGLHGQGFDDGSSDSDNLSDYSESNWDFDCDNGNQSDDRLSSGLTGEMSIANAIRVSYLWTQLVKKRDIRVFEIDRAPTFDSPIRGRLKVISLHDTIDYWTLSYAWGPTAEDGSHLSECVSCSGLPLPVSTHLLSALKRARHLYYIPKLDCDALQYAAHTSPPLLLWVDAICINQTDLDERSDQVMLMGDIYESAKHLVVWLGELRHSLDAAPIPVDPSGSAGFAFCSDVEKERFVVDLISREWFQRRWVIQEYLLSSSVDFSIGHLSVSADRLEALIRSTPSVRLPAILDMGWIQIDKRLNHMTRRKGSATDEKSRLVRRESMARRAPTLLENLLIYHETKCSDPHDLIYALLSISGDADDIPVNYHSSMADLFALVARKYLRAGYGLEILAIAARLKSNCPGGSSDVPPWVPDWRQIEHSAFMPRRHLLAPADDRPEEQEAIELSIAGSCDYEYHKEKILKKVIQVKGLLLDSCRLRDIGCPLCRKRVAIMCRLQRMQPSDHREGTKAFVHASMIDRAMSSKEFSGSDAQSYDLTVFLLSPTTMTERNEVPYKLASFDTMSCSLYELVHHFSPLYQGRGLPSLPTLQNSEGELSLFQRKLAQWHHKLVEQYQNYEYNPLFNTGAAWFEQLKQRVIASIADSIQDIRLEPCEVSVNGVSRVIAKTSRIEDVSFPLRIGADQ